ncbi:DNA cytosine methyltransferase [Hahella ganghwensis]|uniref:DNA cytosine methyltransferase n=1 Tax=Hahella ganghwensis TaxID=286420 RepID=UPI0003715999|nr:DNA cytosine methyltransferase [Hahella ganghwensis]
MSTVEITHFHLFCGCGGGAKGFNQANPRITGLEGKYRCLGGIDVNPLALENFKLLTGVAGTVMDLMNRDQYIAFHGSEPPPEWREATPEDIRKAAGNERPNIGFTSSPCKGLSGLLSQKLSLTPKYQALNELTLRGTWLMMEAWADDPPDMYLFENVPRIQNRGRHLLDKINAILKHFGYAVSETVHDCGELGGLAESRRRFLLVGRHTEKVPPFLYEPPKRSLKPVSSVLEKMPMPGDETAGPMHRIPNLQWKTWVRLAFVEAGKDWRSLNRLNVENGNLKDYLIVPEYRAGYCGVNKWEETVGTIAGRSNPTNGAFSVADPRYAGKDYGAYGVVDYGSPTGTITGQRSPGQGRFAVADPRPTNPFRGGKYRITRFDEAAGTIIAGSTTGQGAFAVADPRPNLHRSKGDNYLTAGHYGVIPWDASTGAVSAAAGHDNGRWSVADPRLPEPNDKLIAMIISMDNTWHRPFTTLELACIQSLIDPEEDIIQFAGKSDSAHREQIGNAVPSAAAKAIAETMGETLLLAWTGETFVLSANSVWVKQIKAGLSLPQEVTA